MGFQVSPRNHDFGLLFACQLNHEKHGQYEYCICSEIFFMIILQKIKIWSIYHVPKGFMIIRGINKKINMIFECKSVKFGYYESLKF